MEKGTRVQVAFPNGEIKLGVIKKKIASWMEETIFRVTLDSKEDIVINSSHLEIVVK